MIAIDTLKFARQLKDAGVPEKQAEAQAEVMSQTITEAMENTLATKADFQESQNETRHEMQKAILELKNDILKTIIGSMVALTAIFSAIVKFTG